MARREDTVVCAEGGVTDFTRLRLLGELDRVHRAHPIVWIAGPSGSGKTALACSYVRTRRLRTVWRHLDPADRDPVAFFQYLARAADRLEPMSNRLPTSGLVGSSWPGSTDVLSTFARSFFDRLFGAVGSPGLIVLDAVEVVAQEPSFATLLRAAEAALSSEVNVMVLGRVAPPPALSDLVLRGAMHVVDGRALALQLDELTALMRSRLGGAFPGLSKFASGLHAETDGWLSGVEARLSELERGHGACPGSNGVEFNAMTARGFDALLRSADQDLRRLLVAFALLPALTPSLASELAGPRGEACAEALLEDGVVSLATSGVGEREYRLANQPRAFGAIFEALTEPEIRTIGRNVARTLALRGQVDWAMTSLQRLGDVEAAAELVLEHGRRLLALGRRATLREWLEWVCSRTTEANPWLQYFRAQLEVHDLEAIALTERAFGAFLSAKIPAGCAMAWAGAVERILCCGGDLRPLDTWLLQLEDEAFPRSELEATVEARLVACAILALLARRPEGAELRNWIERGWLVLQSVVELDVRVSLADALLTYHVWFGPPARIEILFDSVRSDVAGQAPNPTLETWLCHARAVAQLAAGETARSVEAAKQGLSLATATGARRYEAALHLDLAWAGLLGGELEHVPASLANAQASLGGTRAPFVRELYHFARSWQTLAIGDRHAAREHARECAETARRRGSAITAHISHLAEHAVALASRDTARPDIAEGAALGGAFEFAATFLAAVRAIPDDGIEAVSDSALQAVRRSLAFGKAAGFRTLPPAPLAPGSAARLLGVALEHRIEPDFARALIRHHRLDAPARCADLPEWPYPIRVFALGRFQLLVNDEPLRFVGKAQRKPLELLKAVIALGGREVPEEELADALWPDAEADAAERTLAITLHRLRTLLRSDDAIERRARTLTLSERLVWVDTRAFERRAELIRQRSSGHTHGWRRALALYQGPFLSGVDMPCAAVLRERLRSKYVRRVVELAELAGAADGAPEAEEVYLRALDAEPLVERFYLELMAVQARAGRSSDCEATYLRCCDIRKSALGAGPSPELEAARRSLCPPASGVSSTRRAAPLEAEVQRQSRSRR